MNYQSSIANLFAQKNNFLLLIHHSPDGDAIASSLALLLALRTLGKTVDVVCADPIPVQFHFLPSVHKIKHDCLMGDYEVVVTLDCGDSNRTGFRARLKELIANKRIPLVNVDHHPKNDLHALATYNIVDYKAPSTSYLVYRIIHSLSITLDHRIATCLLTGLYTDTGGFKHPNTTPETLKFASLLLASGARLKDISTHITQPSSVGRLKLWGIALSRICHHTTFDIVTTYITHRDIEKTGTQEEDIAGIATLLSTIPSKVAILVVELANKTVQVRMRTKSKQINVAKLANYLGGGGQRRSAGFTLKGMLPLGNKYRFFHLSNTPSTLSFRRNK